MKCPFCHHEELKVVDSRNAIEQNSIKRRRECLQCLKRFTTFELIELSMQVHKRDGRFEDFKQQKLINGLTAACSHTKISKEEVTILGASIVADLIAKGERSIRTHELGEIIMQRLHKLDPIAYIRFACVYRRFKDIDELVEAIDTIPVSC